MIPAKNPAALAIGWVGKLFNSNKIALINVAAIKPPKNEIILMKMFMIMIDYFIVEVLLKDYS
jgi:hypothetical protein